MSAILVKMPPAMRSAAAPSDSPMAKADEAGARQRARDEEQDAQHQQQLDADEQHADAHAGTQRDGVDRERLALEAGEGGARVGEGVDADAEPGDAVAAGDADQAERQDDRQGDADRPPRHRVEPPVVGADDHRDERPQHEDELALGDEVGLARLVDQLRHLEHRLVHRHRLELRERRYAERQAEGAHQQPAHQQRPAVHAVKVDDRQIRQRQRRLTARFRRRRLRRLGVRHPRQRDHRATEEKSQRRDGQPPPEEGLNGHNH